MSDSARPMLERMSIAKRPAIPITQLMHPHGKTLPEMFLARAARTPNRMA